MPAAPEHPTELAETYFDAWQARDWPRLRSVLADDATFVGPMGRAADADECVAGLTGMSRILDRIEVHTRTVAGDDVITWSDLHYVVGVTAPTANWMRVRDGRIAAVRVAFDPRELLEALAAADEDRDDG